MDGINEKRRTTKGLLFSFVLFYPYLIFLFSP